VFNLKYYFSSRLFAKDLNQCFGSRSGFNEVSGFGSGLKIRIRIQEGKNDPQATKVEKIKTLHVFKYWMFSFEG
jgi:hypothetical protein